MLQRFKHGRALTATTPPSASRRLLLLLISLFMAIIFSVIGSEFVLQAAVHFSRRAGTVIFPATYLVAFLPDPQLIYRGNPKFPEHDSNGFRNDGVPETADIVAIGDSHTYGNGVAPDEAWPRVLARLSACRLYNMALSGWGPLQYEQMAERTLRFKARLLVIGIYFGNDFIDSWLMYLRNPARYPVPDNLLGPARSAEQQSALADEANVLEWGGTIAPPPLAPEATPLRIFLRGNSALWGFGRALKARLTKAHSTILSTDFHTAVAALTPKELEYASVFDGEGWRTILTSRYREFVENDDDPRIKVGIWLTKWAIQTIDQLAKHNGSRAIFVLLPTKESVFADKVTDPDRHPYLSKLITDEARHRRDLISYMNGNGISYVDVAPPLKEMERQPYFENADGHPNSAGHARIAEIMYKRIGSCPLH
jgi:hypothetical protein